MFLEVHVENIVLDGRYISLPLYTFFEVVLYFFLAAFCLNLQPIKKICFTEW